MKSSKHSIYPSKALRNTAAVSAGILITALSGSTAEASAASHKRAARVTPLVALTRVLQRLENGGEADVAPKNVMLAGKTGVVKGRPIEFRVNGQPYAAFSEGTEPDFGESPETLAKSMTIIDGDVPGDKGHNPVVHARLNTDHVLVINGNGAAVGYGTPSNP